MSSLPFALCVLSMGVPVKGLEDLLLFPLILSLAPLILSLAPLLVVALASGFGGEGNPWKLSNEAGLA